MSAPAAKQTNPVSARPECSLLITDLDNTLWDWFDIWYRSFTALLAEVVRKSGVPQDTLEGEIRAVHQKHRTSEYALLLQELPSLQALHPGEDIPKLYNDAVHAHRSARKAAAKLYPGVQETLEQVRAAGAVVVGYTESMAFYTSDRLRRTGLDHVLDVLYSAPDHDFPAGLTPAQLRKYEDGHYEFDRTVHKHTPKGKIKPDPELLAKIVADMGARPSEVVYVGDSLMKDVSMARAVGVIDVWAKYGESHRREGYDLLRRVSHWTLADVEREKNLKKEDVQPSYSIESFDELLNLFSFRPRATPPAPIVE
jgi:FMN phosphatase YigB (HAD superfamily)